jgi:hypothetical protein
MAGALDAAREGQFSPSRCRGRCDDAWRLTFITLIHLAKFNFLALRQIFVTFDRDMTPITKD